MCFTDFVLVYQKETQRVCNVTMNEMELEEVDLEKTKDSHEKFSKRENFLEELECVGLEMEEEILEV